MVYHQPNLQIAAVVGTTADKVVEPYKVIKWQFKGKSSPEVVMDNLYCAEERNDCTALTKDAAAAFDVLDREVGCVEAKREPSPS
ncbi:hypothetical protein PG995_008366 [Apiospora arundinis]